MPETGWSKLFEDPVTLPNGRQLVTLLDAGEYIHALPRKETQGEHWQAAMEALLLVAEHDGPTMLARIGMMRGLNAGKPDPRLTPWTKPAKKYRILR
jgi:hypothetical protein